MQLSDDYESNSKDDKILRQIEAQLEILKVKITEVTQDVESMKNQTIVKPIDEIKYWKNKSAKLTKAYKLVNDERVKVLQQTIDWAIQEARFERSEANIQYQAA